MREYILNGELPLPSRQSFIDNVGEDMTKLIERMWKSMWHGFCNKESNSTSTIYWMEESREPKAFLSCIASLTRSGWVVLDTRMNFQSIKINSLKVLQNVTQDELDSIRLTKRFYKYLPYVDNTEQNGKAVVKVFGKSTARKLDRVGMEVGAKSVFQLDAVAMAEDFDIVRSEARKGIENTLLEHPLMAQDRANYSEVMDEILFHLVENPQEKFNMGVNYVDSRGRAIKSHLSKIMNPIGFKVARALLVIPE